MSKKKRKGQRNRPQKSRSSQKPLDRLQKALSENRLITALELGRNLFRAEPTPEVANLLVQAAIGRATELREEGKTRDSCALLESILKLKDLPTQHHPSLAQALLESGGAPTSTGQMSGSADQQEIQRALREKRADLAVQQGRSGRKQLSPEDQTDFDRILLAFDHLQKGEDESVREALKGISLRSPFLEWKLMIRGLAAYYEEDDIRALENWQRLQGDRLPMKLILPLRYSIDEGFRQSQSTELAAILERRLALLQQGSIVDQLKEVQRSLIAHQSLGQTFRQVESFLPVMRDQAPDLIPRLASALYAAILDEGSPEQIQRYQRVFGNPPDDPSFHRMNALGFERGGNFQEAHNFWQRYEKDIEQNPQLFPGSQSKQARALIWHRMGLNAMQVDQLQDLDVLDDFPPFLDEPLRPARLKPSAAECFEKSLKLCPARAATYEALIDCYLEQGKGSKAAKVAESWTKQFPQDHQAWFTYGMQLRREEQYQKALEALQKAAHLNPLSPRTRSELVQAHFLVAREHVRSKKYAEARAEYEAIVRMEEGGTAEHYCSWAACELKAGEEEKAQELLQHAGLISEPIVIHYLMLRDCIRLKLPAAHKKSYDGALKTGFNEGPTARSAVELVEAIALLEPQDEYLGLKSHQKKIIAYAKKALSTRKVSFTETELERLGYGLFRLRAYQGARDTLERGRAHYPRNPLFPFLQAENEIARGPGKYSVWSVRRCLEVAEASARALPADPYVEALLDDIQNRREMIRGMSSFASIFDQIFEPLDEDDFF